MITKKSLDAKIADIWTHGSTRTRALKQDGSIGLELEAEAEAFPESWPLDKKDTFWKAVAENSLRHGIEFILKSPLPLEGLKKALAEWDTEMMTTKFYDSLRTSTHIHVNVYGFTVRQVLHAIAAYWLVENALVNMHGETRVGNLFCLRVSDADALARLLVQEIQDDVIFQESISENFRYSALNLHALRKFGSLEFRFLKGMYRGLELFEWSKAIHDLVMKASKLQSLDNLLALVRGGTPREFLSFFFDPGFVKKILDYNGSKITDFLQENQDIVHDLNVALKAKKFFKPSVTEDEDFRNPEENKNPTADPNVVKFKPSPDELEWVDNINLYDDFVQPVEE